MVRSVEQRGQSWPLENVRILACLKEGEERKKNVTALRGISHLHRGSVS